MLIHQSDDANYLTSPTGGTCDGITCFKKIIAINFFPVNVKYIKAVQKPTKGGWTLNKRKEKIIIFLFFICPKKIVKIGRDAGRVDETWISCGSLHGRTLCRWHRLIRWHTAGQPSADLPAPSTNPRRFEYEISSLFYYLPFDIINLRQEVSADCIALSVICQY